MTCPHCQVWETRYHDLVKTLSEMKREGFTTASTPPDAPKQPELPQVVVQAIYAVASSQQDPNFRHLVGYAWEQLNAGKNPDDIALSITQGIEAEL
jgi:hypothetical protein